MEIILTLDKNVNHQLKANCRAIEWERSRDERSKCGRAVNTVLRITCMESQLTVLFADMKDVSVREYV